MGTSGFTPTGTPEFIAEQAEALRNMTPQKTIEMPTPPNAPHIRLRANQRKCIVGRNRKMRKRFCMWLWTDAQLIASGVNNPMWMQQLQREARHSEAAIYASGRNDPIWMKRLRREARHSESAFELAESMGLYA